MDIDIPIDIDIEIYVDTEIDIDIDIDLHRHRYRDRYNDIAINLSIHVGYPMIFFKKTIHVLNHPEMERNGASSWGICSLWRWSSGVVCREVRPWVHSHGHGATPSQHP